MLDSLLITFVGCIIIYFYFIFLLDIGEDIKFRNEILDLDTERQYSLNEIKNLFRDIYKYKKSLHEFNEYHIKHIIKLLEEVKGELVKKETKYYTLPMAETLSKIFSKQKVYKNNKSKLLVILSSILDELKEEKNFFGLNTREREILISLSRNENLSEVDKRSILELKDIVTNRYQELIKNNEQSNILSKRSMKVGYVSLIITFITSFPYIKTWLLEILN